MYVIAGLPVTIQIETECVHKMCVIRKTHLREEYWYVQIDTGEDQRVEYVMHGFDSQLKMQKSVPKYPYELKRQINPEKQVFNRKLNRTIVTEDR